MDYSTTGRDFACLREDGILNYADFRRVLIRRVQESCGDGFVVSEQKVIKNNSVELYGINIREKILNISPTIYLERFYSEYFDGKMSIEEVHKELLAVYSRNRMKSGMDTDIVTDFEKAKNYLAYRLVNKDRNLQLLKDIPHIDYLDLAIVFYLRLEKIGGSITIKNEHVKLWDADIETVMKAARENAEKYYEPVLDSIGNIVRKMAKREELDYDEAAMVQEGVYVLTNPSGLYGASCILDPTVLSDIAESLGCGFYLLPSSLHETIIMSEALAPDSEQMRRMVKDVNISSVDNEDILSDSVYYYDMKERVLTIAE